MRKKIKFIVISFLTIGILGTSLYALESSQLNRSTVGVTVADKLFSWVFPVPKFPSTGDIGTSTEATSIATSTLETIPAEALSVATVTPELPVIEAPARGRSAAQTQRGGSRLKVLGKSVLKKREQTTEIIRPNHKDGSTNIIFYDYENGNYQYSGETSANFDLPLADYYAPESGRQKFVAVEYFNDGGIFGCSGISLSDCIADPHFISESSFEITADDATTTATSTEPISPLTPVATTTEATTTPPFISAPSTEATSTPSIITATTTEATSTPPLIIATSTEATSTPPETIATTTEATSTPPLTTATSTEATSTPPSDTATSTEATSTPPDLFPIEIPPILIPFIPAIEPAPIATSTPPPETPTVVATPTEPVPAAGETVPGLPETGTAPTAGSKALDAGVFVGMLALLYGLLRAFSVAKFLK